MRPYYLYTMLCSVHLSMSDLVNNSENYNLDKLPIQQKSDLFYISQQLNDIKEVEVLFRRILKRSKKRERLGLPTRISLVEAMNDAIMEELSDKKL